MSEIDGRRAADIGITFQRALTLHQQGQLAQAEFLYRAIISQVPKHFDALHLLGVIEHQRRNYKAALRLIGQALKLDPKSAMAHANIAAVFHDSGRHQEAVASCDRALAISPDFAAALYNRGSALLALKRHEEALASNDRALAIKPDYAEAATNRGNALLALKRYEEALASFDRAIAIKPNYAEAANNLGNALLALKRHEEALASFDRAIEIKPNYAEAHYNRANALSDHKFHDEALSSYNRALAIKPDYSEAANNRGNALQGLKRLAEALASYDRALAIRPDYAEALTNRGIVLYGLKRHAEALASLNRALATRPDHATSLYNRGRVLLALKRFAEATEDFERLLVLKPDFDYARGEILGSQISRCDWNNYRQNLELVVKSVASGKPAANPFIFLAVSHSPGDTQKCSRIFNEDLFPPEQAIWRGERYQHEKIRVAYLSADFRQHAVAYSMVELFETHDRVRFETIAISFGPDGEGEFRTRLENAFDRFIDVRSKNDRDVALLLRELEIDIAVDLMGYTQDCRTGIFAFRPAPAQVSFLGFPGTMGADYIDYILADRVVIPEDQHSFYTEKIAYLPDSYYPNDSKRRISQHTPTRDEAGLPATAIVFCSFSNNYKIAPPVFDVWMRLLHQVEGSVLWLLEDNAAAAGNLRREAELRGIASDRLVFAPRIKLEDHLARQRLADIFLDTLPYNAHTTASDALWVGLPVVTCLGSGFAGRVAGSLLNAVGLPELVTHNLEAYEALALTLARDKDMLAAVKAKLAQNREIFPLFNTGRYCRHVERAYEMMWERCQRGEPAASFAVVEARE